MPVFRKTPNSKYSIFERFYDFQEYSMSPSLNSANLSVLNVRHSPLLRLDARFVYTRRHFSFSSSKCHHIFFFHSDSLITHARTISSRFFSKSESDLPSGKANVSKITNIARYFNFTNLLILCKLLCHSVA